jgi:cytochrome b561
MTDRTVFDTATRIVAADEGTDYDNVAIALHWATAFLVFSNFVLAQTWDWFPKTPRVFMQDTHMSFGVLLTLVIVARLVWRLIPGHQVSPIELGWVRIASKAMHYLLYGLLVVEAAAGFGFRWGRGAPMEFFGLGIPPLIGELGRPVRHLLHDIHEWVAWAIVIIAFGHALAALYHHYVLKDRVLERMLPKRAS